MLLVDKAKKLTVYDAYNSKYVLLIFFTRNVFILNAKVKTQDDNEEGKEVRKNQKMLR